MEYGRDLTTDQEILKRRQKRFNRPGETTVVKAAALFHPGILEESIRGRRGKLIALIGVDQGANVHKCKSAKVRMCEG